MEIIVDGFKFGIVLFFLIGPVFFTIIQTSIERGFWNGVRVSVGVLTSDIMYISICYFGFFQFLDKSIVRTSMSYIGGGILIVLGLYHLFIKTRTRQVIVVNSEQENNRFKYFVKGFLINGINPMVFIFWIGTFSIATINLGYTKGFNLFLFFSSLLFTVFTSDILKAYLADKLRLLITNRFLFIVNVLVGIVLILFGIKLLVIGKTGLE